MENDEVLSCVIRKVDSVANCCVVTINGFIDAYNSSYLQVRTNKIIQDGFLRIIFDCKNLTGISSAGYVILIDLFKKVSIKQGKVILINVNHNICKTIDLLGFGSILKIADSFEEAIR